MRERERVLGSLERVYREAFQEADDAGDQDRMRRLDFDYQRDQVFLEVLLDVRDILALPDAEQDEDAPSLLERAQALRNLSRLR